MSTSKLFLQVLRASLILPLFVLAACQLPTPQKTELDNTASYFIFTADGKFTSTTNHANLSIPLSRTLNYSVCLKENNHSLSVINHTFLIKGGPKELRINTDAVGCLIWNEELAFNYLADEKFITVQRTISPLGQQKGDRKVELIVNPWVGTVFSTIDSRVSNPIPAANAKMSLMGSEQTNRRSLWLDWVRLNVMQDKIDKEQGSYNIEVSATLLVERLDEKNERILVPLTYGKVIGQIQLICAITPADQRAPMRVVIAQMDNIHAEVQNGSRIFLNSRFSLKEFCPTTAYLMAGITVRVPDAPALLAPFQGLYHGGPAQNMVGQMFSVADGTFVDRFTKDKDYSIATYLSENKAIYRNGTTPLPTVNSQGEVVPVPMEVKGQAEQADRELGAKTPELMQKFRVEVREIEATPYGAVQQYFKDREATFRVRACLRLGIDQSTMRAVEVKVTKINGTTAQIVTQDDGCLQFEDSIRYNHFEKECWFDKQLRFENSAFGFSQDFKIQINPWSRGGSWFKDVRWLPEDDRKLRCTNRSSQILLDYYFLDYATNRYQYSLDAYLGLNQTRVGNLTLRPLLYRGAFDSPTGYITEPLPAGRYLLRWALLDQSVTEYTNQGALKNRIYALDRTVVTVREDGAITDRVGIRINSEALMSLGLLNQFILELVPLQEGANLAPDLNSQALENFVDTKTSIQVVPFVAGFVARAEGGGLRKLSEFSGKSLILELEKTFQQERLQNQELMKRLARKETLAKVNHLKLINLNDANQISVFKEDFSQRRDLKRQISPESLKDLMENGVPKKNMANALCGYIIDELWSRPLPGKNHGFLDDTPGGGKARELHKECLELFYNSPREAFDLEYQYVVENPQLMTSERCSVDAAGAPQCARQVVPQRVDPRFFVVYNNFSMSRAESVTGAYQAKAELGFNIAGMGGGTAYNTSHADDRSQANTVGFDQNMIFTLETLRFKIQAQDGERCLMVRLNPILFEREDTNYKWVKSLFNLQEKTIFNRYLHPDLSEEERAQVTKLGVLLCDGQKLGRKLEFTESFYMIRPNSPMGVLGDEKSRATVEGLFATMRGINDMTAFLGFVSHSEKIPPTFEREFQARQMDTSKLREAFLRGTRSLPGVFSSLRPL